MKRGDTLKIAIVLFSFISVVAFFYVMSKHSKKVEGDNEDYKLLENWIIQRDKNELLISLGSINENVYLFNEIEDSLNATSVFRNNKISVLLIIPEHSCGYCLDSEIRNVKAIKKKFPEGVFKIITKHIYKKEIRDFKVFNNIETFDVLSMGKNDLVVSPPNMQSPYFVIIDNDLNIFNVHIPNPSMPRLTEQFLGTVMDTSF